MDFIIGVLGTIGLLFIAAIAGVLIGAASGLVVGLFFSDTIMTTLARFGVGVHNLEVWQVGATLGFISGFFRSTIRSETKK